MFEIFTNTRFFFIVFYSCLHECGNKSCLSGARIIQPVRLDPHVSWFSRMDNVVTGHVSEGLIPLLQQARQSTLSPRAKEDLLACFCKDMNIIALSGKTSHIIRLILQGHPVSDNRSSFNFYRVLQSCIMMMFCPATCGSRARHIRVLLLVTNQELHGVILCYKVLYGATHC